MIEMKGISKKFDQIQAVSKVSGEIREGSVFGLVGTNGAGKCDYCDEAGFFILRGRRRCSADVSYPVYRAFGSMERVELAAF